MLGSDHFRGEVCAHVVCVCVKQDRELATLLREGHAHEDPQRTLLAAVWAQRELSPLHDTRTNKTAQAAHILF